MHREACVIAAKDFGGRICLFKNRDRRYDAKLRVYHFECGGVEAACVFDTKTGFLEGVNQHGIGIVNTSLLVLRDEAEGKTKKTPETAKKRIVKSREGPQILEALSKRTLKDALASLLASGEGIRGHTFLSDGDQLLSIERTRTNPAKVRRLDASRVNARTNHGVTYPEAGYTHGEDYISSIVRRWETQKRLQRVTRPELIGPALVRPIDTADSPYNPVRVTNDMRTTSQLLIDTKRPSLVLYLVKDHCTLLPTRNLLPRRRSPSIPVKVYCYKSRMEER